MSVSHDTQSLLTWMIQTPWFVALCWLSDVDEVLIHLQIFDDFHGSIKEEFNFILILTMTPGLQMSAEKMG